jgi:hypothetical protein
VVCGDATGDGEIKTADALIALRTAVGSASCELARCDYTGDGEVKTGDALAILRVAVGQVLEPKCPAAALLVVPSSTVPATSTTLEDDDEAKELQ